jgi:hypothetical protein
MKIDVQAFSSTSLVLFIAAIPVMFLAPKSPRDRLAG